MAKKSDSGDSARATRCGWARSEFAIPYHDTEWGVPCHDDRLLFEHLLLDGAQAGLSWNTILQKREGYRRAFDGFDPEKIAGYDRRKVERLLKDPGIVRNRLKVESAVTNARAFLELCSRRGSFDAYLWEFVGGETRVNRWRQLKEIPARSVESDRLSQDLKQHGFKFAGTVICYAFMQAVGMFNDHLVGCFRHGELSPGG